MGFDTTTDIGEELNKVEKKSKSPKPVEENKPGTRGKKYEKDFKKYAKYRKYAYPVILVILAFLVFSQTASVPIAGKLAQAYTERIAESQIISDISRQSPYLPMESKRERAEEATKEFLKTDEARNRIESETERIRNYYQTPQGVTYLYRFDPYLYLRRAGNLLDYGSIGEYEEEGESYETLRYAPMIMGADKSLSPYAIAGMSYILNPMEPDEQQGAFWLPVLLGILSVLLIYAAGKYLFNSEVGFVAGILFAITRASVSVFHGGSADTPPLNIFFSILIVLLAIYSFKNIFKNKLKAVLALAAAGLTYFLFTNTWSGAPYILFILLLGGLIYSFLELKNRGKTREMYLVGSAGILIAIAGYIFRGVGFIHVALKRLGLNTSESYYPTAWSTIAELQAMSLSSLWDIFGGLVIIVSIVGFLILAYNQWSKPDEKLILLAWYPAIVLPLITGRFYMYALPPVILLAAYGVMKTGSWLSNIDFGFTPFWSRLGWTALLVGVIVATLVPGTTAEINKYPYVDDAINQVGTEINIETNSDAIITTWWDYGYIYQYYADRATTFDGGSFEPERLYWVARTLIEKNETRASGILRMLNCGGERRAFNILNRNNEPSDSIEILNDVLAMNKESASQHVSDEVLQYTHCNNTRPGVLVVSSDMLDKLGVFNHFANWNFEYGLSISEEIQLQRGNCQGNTCDYGVRYNETEATIQGQHPKKFIHVSSNFTNKTVLEYEDGVDVTILVVGEYDAFYMEPGFEDTMLIKSLYLGEMENFDLLTMRDLRKRITAWNVEYP